MFVILALEFKHETDQDLYYSYVMCTFKKKKVFKSCSQDKLGNFVNKN